jgi:multidrug efflux pump subunit AcrB
MTQPFKFNLSRWALEHQAFTRYFLVVLLFGGLLAYGNLGQDEDPPFTFRVMAIRTYWPGATAQQVAEQVLDKLEKKLQEVPFADKIHSYVKPGEGVIIFEVRNSTAPREVPNAWYQVRKKIGDIAHTLPAGVQGPFFNDEFGDTFGTIYSLSADGFSYEDLRRYSEFVRQEMLRVPNVAKVDLFGAQDEKVTIEFSHRKFSQLGISVTQIIDSIAQRNAVEASGLLTTTADNVQVRISGQFHSLDDIRQLELRANGNTIRLGDFARVQREFLDPAHDKMRFNGKEVIGIGISMQKGGDIIQLGRDLKEVADRLKVQLPVGIEIGKVQDQPKSVSRSVSEFVSVLVEAVVIVLAVSFLSLGLHRKPSGRGYYIDVRPGLVVGLTIPLVLAVTFLLMDIFGIGLHKISLGALIIALGLLVDDAIIAVEMMVRKLEEGFSRMEAATAVWSSTAMPMLTGTLITVAGFLPVGLAKSVAGEYTFSIFAVTAFALVVSWFAAVISTPYLGYLILNTKSKVSGAGHHELFDTPGYRKIRRAVDWSVEHRRLVIASTLGAFILGGLSFKFIEQQFFPDSSRPELMVELWMPEGSSFSNTESAAKEFEAWVSQQPGVVSVTAFIGTGAPRFYLPLDQILPQTNVSQLIVLPEDLKARASLRKAIESSFRDRFTNLRGRVKLLPNGPPVAYPVQFRVQGPEVMEVRRIANAVKQVMRENTNTVGVNDNWNESVKVVRIDIDQEKLKALGVSSQLIAQAANTVLSGSTIGRYRERDRLIDIQIRQPSDERTTVDSISNASIPTASGKSVPLAQLARVSLAWEPGVMWRENRDWAVTVQSDVREGIQGATVTLQIDPELEKLRQNLPPGYYIKIAGAIEQSATASKSIAVNLPLTVFVIFTLLMVQLQSVGRALMIFLTGPLGVIGAAFALLLFQAPFGFVAQLGVIALVGMIIRNSVILVDQIEQDRATGVDAWTAIVESAVRRFRPIVLTAAAAVLAMIPLSRSVFWGPMAVAIMGGLIVATALTMLVLPALYAAWYRVQRSPAVS